MKKTYLMIITLLSITSLSACDSNNTSVSSNTVESSNSSNLEVELLKEELAEKDKELTTAQENADKIIELEKQLSEKDSELQILKEEIATVNTTMTDEVAEKIWNTITPSNWEAEYKGFTEEVISGWCGFEYGGGGVGNVPSFRRYGNIALIKQGVGDSMDIKVVDLTTEKVITEENFKIQY
ncbi:hypothetical protein FG877_02175 [Enterococcus casseliflavus]|nr:hypothetical protein [Enterococcus casseliflavus]